uniref:NADH-ubiquinone oxidoreductase chain 5 n=1 Tax=Falcolipeurus quadripustulatus TaxID=2358485 RepID=A0A386B2M2_9NEOP|nr:NADH dehydrogenase subunit 5 [Falcolipeurus quadripustulatus]
MSCIIGIFIHMYVSNYIWIMIMIFFFVVFFFLLSLFSVDLQNFINFSILLKSDLNFSLGLVFDYVSLLYIFTVLLVSLLVMFYSLDYMKDEKMLNKFFFNMVLFILSMILLSCSSSVFWVMVGWDGLGITSFFLIIYFQNWKSFNSGMTTFICNRIGDLFLISSIVFFFEFGSFSCNLNYSVDMFVCSILLMIASFTKSAQLPFSVWLPLAMAAPTPVSSLVHSSTLVTAGIFIMIRFSLFLENELYSNVIYLFSSVTIVLSGLSAMWEFDLKKIIALSTLCHVGLMMFFISIGEVWSAMIHLVMHAFFKSLLFMSAGILIHENYNLQDIRLVFLNFNFNKKIWVSLMISCASMMGLPFLSGFYSKDLLALSISSDNLVFSSFVVFFLAVMFTVIYSVRLMYMISLCFFSFTVFKIFEDYNKMHTSTFLGSIFSSVFGGLILWSLMNLENFNDFGIFIKDMKFFIFFFVFLGILISLNQTKFLSKNNISMFFSKMWFINSSILFMQKSFLNYSFLNFYYCNKGLVEFFFESFYNSSSFFNKSLKFNSFFPWSVVLFSISFYLLLVFFFNF